MIIEALAGIVAILLTARTAARETDGPLLPWLVGTASVAAAPAVLALASGMALAPFVVLGPILAATLAIAVIDHRTRIIPDMLVVVLAALTVMAPFRPAFSDQILGAVVMGVLFFGVRNLHFALRRIEGLGLGDVKLAIVMGAMLGAQPALLSTAAAAGFTALVVVAQTRSHPQSADASAVMKAEAPFGVGLAAALAVMSAVAAAGWR